MKLANKLEGNFRVTVFVVACVLAMAFAGVSQISAGDFIYVDDDASGKMDGSSDHPFDSIQDAIDKASDKGKKVVIKKGEYEENFSIWEDVEVNGEGADKVTIKTDDNDGSVVTMYHNTELRDVTVRSGKYGVTVKGEAGVIIEDCVIKKNKRDGIRAKYADTSNKKRLIVLDTEIKDNGWSGIYTEQRKVVIEDSEIYENGKDGIDLSKRSEGTIKNNYIARNAGVGIKVIIDDSDTYIKKNTVRDNGRDGIEVRAHGETGYMVISQNKLYRNNRWGIARLEKREFSDWSWNESLKIIGDNTYWENDEGGVSPIIVLY